MARKLYLSLNYTALSLYPSLLVPPTHSSLACSAFNAGVALSLSLSLSGFLLVPSRPFQSLPYFEPSVASELCLPRSFDSASRPLSLAPFWTPFRPSTGLRKFPTSCYPPGCLEGSPPLRSLFAAAANARRTARRYLTSLRSARTISDFLFVRCIRLSFIFLVRELRIEKEKGKRNWLEGNDEEIDASMNVARLRQTSNQPL